MIEKNKKRIKNPKNLFHSSTKCLMPKKNITKKELMKGLKKIIKQKIDAIDRQIDNLVYKLYDLTEEEIRIVEENR